MTTPTGQAAETPAADGAARAEARPRPTRRSPTELVLRFPDRDLAEALVAERGEPEWLGAERLAA
ncbi:MAG TPA: hypothetical protein VNJ28_04310, partial [Candidatus Limnocylindrales bacterium]|nr:hypothetical protein [Candidatus Limnocylindrales bacterium]